MIAIRGYGSRIAQELAAILPANEKVTPVPREGHDGVAERHLFCQGVLRNKTINDQTPDEIASSWTINATRTIDQCERILSRNDRARICIIGSESAFAGSYDVVYAAAKAGVHQYVETRRLRTPMQQLVCVSPGIVADAGMTLRREDKERLEAREKAHPKARFVTSREVAVLVHHVLYVDRGYLSGVVIRMNGGEHTK